jgi:hypothetical protein
MNVKEKMTLVNMLLII